MKILSRDEQNAVVSALTEGCSSRATERLTGIHRDTIVRGARRDARLGAASNRGGIGSLQTEHKRPARGNMGEDSGKPDHAEARRTLDIYASVGALSVRIRTAPAVSVGFAPARRRASTVASGTVTCSIHLVTWRKFSAALKFGRTWLTLRA